MTPELVDAMDPHEVPCGGPGLNSMHPCDTELYCKGHIEVPNLLGNDVNCNTDGLQHRRLRHDARCVRTARSTYGAAGIPPGAIVPTRRTDCRGRRSDGHGTAGVMCALRRPLPPTV